MCIRDSPPSLPPSRSPDGVQHYWCAEKFIEGNYEKHSGNNGFVQARSAASLLCACALSCLPASPPPPSCPSLSSLFTLRSPSPRH
eukprot:1409613-Rhodomonas_salina.1